MTMLQPLRDALEKAINACQRAEKELIRAARKEGKLSVAWDHAAAACEHLRTFDHIMASIKAERDKQTT